MESPGMPTDTTSDWTRMDDNHAMWIDEKILISVSLVMMEELRLTYNGGSKDGKTF